MSSIRGQCLESLITLREAHDSLTHIPHTSGVLLIKLPSILDLSNSPKWQCPYAVNVFQQIYLGSRILHPLLHIHTHPGPHKHTTKVIFL